MSFKTIEVGIQPDAIEAISKVSADKALEELIWNALDAEADLVDVAFFDNGLGSFDRICVSDDGHGISHEFAEEIFGSIGGSSKRLRRRSPILDRPYHGQNGQGRYKAFSIGRHVVWLSRTSEGDQVQEFEVQLESSNPKSAKIGKKTSSSGKRGCDVVITDIRDKLSGLRSDAKRDSLTFRFAPYLIGNPSVQIRYDGKQLDVHELLSRDHTLDVIDEEEEGPANFKLRILEWSKSRAPRLYLCDEFGVIFDEVELKRKGERFSYSAYILSDQVRELHETDRLVSGGLDPAVRELTEAARATLHNYVRQRNAEEARLISDRIKKDGLYPYADVAATPVERAERQVFDVCAATIHEYLPAFEKSDKNSRKFTYRLLREALEGSPSNVGVIFSEVLKLTGEQQENLAFLLGRTSLGAIINTAKTVADRLAFINGLEQITHEKTIRKHLKERTQLHRILVQELWLFGDAYTLGGDDVTLRTCLNEHRKLLDVQELSNQIPNEELTDLNDIPDLLLWKQYLRGKDDEFEHLVIELKRPTKNISLEDITQAKRYASKVMNNKHFDKDRTHWTFWILSDGIAEDAKQDVAQRDREHGHVAFGDNYDVWVRTWPQIIHEAKVRLKWVQKRLELKVEDNSEGMEYLRRKYSHLLPDEAKQQEHAVEQSEQAEVASN
jgi:hypothetical protein